MSAYESLRKAFFLFFGDFLGDGVSRYILLSVICVETLPASSESSVYRGVCEYPLLGDEYSLYKEDIVGLFILGRSVLPEAMESLLPLQGAGTPLPYTELDVVSLIISRFSREMDADVAKLLVLAETEHIVRMIIEAMVVRRTLQILKLVF